MNNVLIGNLKSKTSWVSALVVLFGILYDNWSQVAVLIPPGYVGKAFQILGVVMLVLRNLSKDSIPDKASSQGGFARVGLLAFISTILLILFGCQTFQQNQSTSHLATDVAVVKFIENSSPEKKQSRIDHIRQIALSVKAITANDATATIPSLETVVSSEIDKLGLTPSDRVLALDLVRVLVDELKARVGQNILSNDQKLQVATVMDWIIQAVDSLPKT